MTPRRILTDVAIVLPIAAASVYGLSPWLGIFRASIVGTCVGLLVLEYRSHWQEMRDEKKKKP